MSSRVSTIPPVTSGGFREKIGALSDGAVKAPWWDFSLSDLWSASATQIVSTIPTPEKWEPIDPTGVWDSGRFQTTPDDSGRFRTAPDDSERLRIMLGGPTFRNWLRNYRSRIGVDKFYPSLFSTHCFFYAGLTPWAECIAWFFKRKVSLIGN